MKFVAMDTNTLLRLLTVCSLLIAISNAAITLAGCRDNVPPGYNTCYYLNDATETWEDANVTCSSINGTLLAIKDQETQDYIESNLEGAPGYDAYQRHWIGAKVIQFDGWRWLDGVALGLFSRWAQDYPKQDMGGYVMFSIRSGYYWENFNSGGLGKMSYICEVVPGMCSNGINYIAILAMGRCFHVYTDARISWFGARDACQNDYNPNSASLAKINSEVVFDIIQNDLIANNNSFASSGIFGFWIGLHGEDWVWAYDELPLSFSNWEAENPKNLGGCAYLRPRCCTEFFWENTNCSSPRQSVCEVKEPIITTLEPVTATTVSASSTVSVPTDITNNPGTQISATAPTGSTLSSSTVTVPSVSDSTATSPSRHSIPYTSITTGTEPDSTDTTLSVVSDSLPTVGTETTIIVTEDDSTDTTHSSRSTVENTRQSSTTVSSSTSPTNSTSGTSVSLHDFSTEILSTLDDTSDVSISVTDGPVTDDGTGFSTRVTTNGTDSSVTPNTVTSASTGTTSNNTIPDSGLSTISDISKPDGLSTVDPNITKVPSTDNPETVTTASPDESTGADLNVTHPTLVPTSTSSDSSLTEGSSFSHSSSTGSATTISIGMGNSSIVSSSTKDSTGIGNYSSTTLSPGFSVSTTNLTETPDDNVTTLSTSSSTSFTRSTTEFTGTTISSTEFTGSTLPSTSNTGPTTSSTTHTGSIYSTGSTTSATGGTNPTGVTQPSRSSTETYTGSSTTTSESTKGTGTGTQSTPNSYTDGITEDTTGGGGVISALSVGEIAGISVGCVCGAVLIILLIVCCCGKCRRENEQSLSVFEDLNQAYKTNGDVSNNDFAFTNPVYNADQKSLVGSEISPSIADVDMNPIYATAIKPVFNNNKTDFFDMDSKLNSSSPNGLPISVIKTTDYPAALDAEDDIHSLPGTEFVHVFDDEDTEDEREIKSPNRTILAVSADPTNDDVDSTTANRVEDGSKFVTTIVLP